jgi:LL-diaminopimelate aminotransferase
MVDELKAARLAGIGEYYFSQKLRELDELRKAGRTILNLGIGNPDMPPHPSVMTALTDALSEPDFHKYQSYKGLPELRQAFATWYKKFFDVELDAEREILPLMGSKEGITHVCMAFLNDGDLALVPNPGYPTYAAAVKLAGGEPVFYSLKESNGCFPDVDALEKLDLSRVKLMLVNYPHMPTGTAGSENLFAQLIAFCRKHDIILVNDNPYAFILSEKPVSLLAQSLPGDLVLELNSLSKSHNMPGWRVGMIGGNAELIQQVLTFKSQMDSGMFKPIMRAAIEALKLDADWFKSLNETYTDRQRKVMDIARTLGCTVNENQVGMFVWARIPDHAASGEHFADELLKRYDIFVPPGFIFGSEGERFIRFSLCSDLDVWNTVLTR